MGYSTQWVSKLSCGLIGSSSDDPAVTTGWKREVRAAYSEGGNWGEGLGRGLGGGAGAGAALVLDDLLVVGVCAARKQGHGGDVELHDEGVSTARRRGIAENKGNGGQGWRDAGAQGRQIYLGNGWFSQSWRERGKVARTSRRGKVGDLNRFGDANRTTCLF